MKYGIWDFDVGDQFCNNTKNNSFDYNNCSKDYEIINNDPIIVVTYLNDETYNKIKLLLYNKSILNGIVEVKNDLE